MCRSRPITKSEQLPKAEEHENAIFNSLCTVTMHRGRKSVILDHHLYHESTDTWVKEPSQPQPHIKLLMRVQREDYEQFGFAPQANQRNATVYAMADTGCQSCLAGIDNVHKLGLHKRNLIPVKIRMHAANNDNINILEAAILRFSGQDGSGNVVETRQLVYVTDTSSQLFFSKEACIALRVITDRFPTVGEVPPDQHPADITVATHCNTVSDANPRPSTDCNCPKRTLPPSHPTGPPIPATVNNSRSTCSSITAQALSILASTNPYP